MARCEPCMSSEKPLKRHDSPLPKIGSKVKSNYKYKQFLESLTPFVGKVLSVDDPIVVVEENNGALRRVNAYWLDY